jgi:hypothetical protein
VSSGSAKAYELHAREFLCARDEGSIGAGVIERWSNALAPGIDVLEIAASPCEFGPEGLGRRLITYAACQLSIPVSRYTGAMRSDSGEQLFRSQVWRSRFYRIGLSSR